MTVLYVWLSLCRCALACSLTRKVGKGRDGHMLAEINVAHRARTTHAQSDLKFVPDTDKNRIDEFL